MTDEKTILREALAPFALVGSELPGHVKFTISVLDGEERMLQIDQDAFVKAFAVYSQTAEETVMREPVKQSHSDAWPLTDADGEPFHRRGANRVTPNPKPEYEYQEVFERKLRRDSIHGIWLIPLVLLFAAALLLILP